MTVNFWITALTSIEVLVALLLIAVVLVQQTKSGGGLGSLGGATTEQVFGAGASNILVKITIVLASVFFVITLGLVTLTSMRQQSKSVIEKIKPADATAAAATRKSPAALAAPAVAVGADVKAGAVATKTPELEAAAGDTCARPRAEPCARAGPIAKGSSAV